MKKRPLQVSLQVREPSVIELTVGERVQLDRLTRSPQGYIPERHGSLLEPGVTMLSLSEGHYWFKTLSDANLHVVRGGVEAQVRPQEKRGWPDPPLSGAGAPPVPGGTGDEPMGESPTFTID